MGLLKKANTEKKSYTVTFTYDSAYAKKVQLLGDFNAWSESSASMKGKNGTFSVSLELPSDAVFQFRYLIDGQSWDNDSHADYYVDSPFSGIQNSVVVLDALHLNAPSNTKKPILSKPSAASKKATPVAKKEAVVKAAPVVKEKAPAKAVAPKKVEAKKVEAKKVETKKVETKAVAAPKKAETKKVAALAKKAETKKAAVPAKKIAPSKPDDLKLIEGIGPKIAELLVKAGIETFAKLSKAKVEDVKKVLDTAGSKMSMHDPSSWAKQAALAAAGDMKALKALQDVLIGGKKK
jgi:predicted flap endonuclease-1-like 5' DNA nuclease